MQREGLLSLHETSNEGQKTRQPNSFQQVENLKANS